jgi:LuxR family quorum sensing-dependent transcriptional regulator
MLLTNTGYQLIERLERQQDVPSLLASFQTLIEAFGMSSFCVGDLSPRKPRAGWHWDGTWSVALTLRYAGEKFFSIDPIVARLNAMTTQFRWSATYAHAGAKGRRVLHEVAALGLTDGLAIPIPGPGGIAAGVSIGTDSYQLSRDDERALHIASLFMHARLSQLRPGACLEPIGQLTPRECECLAWIASGKTDWEISQILDISQQTVHGYVQSALAKLGARTRAQAVALAMHSGQILQ